ncbi:hypothetical protein GVN18_09680 [Pseudomonas sp. ODNR1LW]|nr:hypothetical protein [Pseudomonas sp. ODNR1LW]
MPGSDAKAKEIEQKTKNLFEVLKRLDVYIGTTNTKCTIIMSYCAAVIGLTTLLISRSVSDVSHPAFLVFIGLFSIIVIASSIVCMWMAISVIFPVTFSSPENYSGSSVIFFGDVSAIKKESSGYCARIRDISDAEFLDDLSGQVFTLSRIVSGKFERIKKLSWCLLLFNFIPTAILLIGCVIYFIDSRGVF